MRARIDAMIQVDRLLVRSRSASCRNVGSSTRIRERCPTRLLFAADAAASCTSQLAIGARWRLPSDPRRERAVYVVGWRRDLMSAACDEQAKGHESDSDGDLRDAES